MPSATGRSGCGPVLASLAAVSRAAAKPTRPAAGRGACRGKPASRGPARHPPAHRGEYPPVALRTRDTWTSAVVARAQRGGRRQDDCAGGRHAGSGPAGPRPVTGSRPRRGVFCRRDGGHEARCGKRLVMGDGGDSVTGLPEPGGSGAVVLDGMRVLRLCSVFEPAALSETSAGYDAIGGMQNHTAELSRQLDRMGAAQLILTSRLDGPPGRTGFGQRGQVVRTGVDIRRARQGWALLAAPLALGRGPVDVVHGHCGEDIAVLPLARAAARRHRCPLVITVHASVRHNMRVTSARTAWLRLAGPSTLPVTLAAALPN